MQIGCNKNGHPIAQVGVDSYIEPESWRLGGVLKPGLHGFCDYYLTTNSAVVKEVAVNVEITGRTIIRRQGDWYVRLRITFVGDGQPNTHTGGWVRAL